MAGAEGTSGRKSSRKRAAATSSGAQSRRRGTSKPTKTAGAAAGNGASADALLPEGKLYYRIGEVAKITGVKPHVLRYWETEFRWMAPPKSRSKQRLYRRKDIEMILLIKRLLYDERYTIAGARQQLRELGLAKALEGATEPAASSSDVSEPEATAASPDSAAAAAAAAVAELRNGYRRIRRELQALREVL